MVWVDIIAVLILIFSFIGGLKEGAIKSLLSFISLIIAIPITGATYYLLTSAFGFIADANWRNFLGFFGTFVIISIILGMLLWLPRHFFEKFWNGGCIFGIVGGFFSLVSAAISMALLAIIINAFPVFDWLDYALTNSSVISWLVANLGFIEMMLPQLSMNNQILMTMFRIMAG
jgi:uncharacterized membrane protein required for colicin V production